MLTGVRRDIPACKIKGEQGIQSVCDGDGKKILACKAQQSAVSVGSSRIHI